MSVYLFALLCSAVCSECDAVMVYMPGLTGEVVQVTFPLQAQLGSGPRLGACCFLIEKNMKAVLYRSGWFPA